MKYKVNSVRLSFLLYTTVTEDFSDPILPPEGEDHKGRYESADLDIDELKKYLLDTGYENEESLVEELSGRYKMTRRKSLTDIEMNMTREYRAVGADVSFSESDREEDSFKGEPLSHTEPKSVFNHSIVMQNGNTYTLSIYEVLNGGMESRFEYVLDIVNDVQ